jgi:hypothetical protein
MRVLVRSRTGERKKEKEAGDDGAGPLNTVPLFHLGSISNRLVIIALVHIRRAVSHHGSGVLSYLSFRWQSWKLPRLLVVAQVLFSLSLI